jgi:hypothetical protein
LACLSGRSCLYSPRRPVCYPSWRTSPAVGTAAFALSLLLLAAPLTSRADNLFVSNQGNNTIEEFNSSGVGKLFASSGLDEPEGLAFDSSGNLYVANKGLHTIEKFNSSGVGTFFAPSLGASFGLAFDSTGNLYASNLGDGTIEEFNANGVGTVVASGLDYPSGLAFEEMIPEPSTWAMVALGIGAVLGGRRFRHRSP